MIIIIIYNPEYTKANKALGFSVLAIKRHIMVSPGQGLPTCEDKGSKTN